MLVYRYSPVKNKGCTVREMLSVFQGITGYAALYWDSTYENLSVEVYERSLRKLRKHLLAVYRTTRTYGFYQSEMACGATDPYKLAHVVLLDEEMEELLVEISDNHLFFQDEFGDPCCPLDDLALFRKDGTMILGSCSHEESAALYVEEGELEGILLPDGFRLHEGEVWMPEPVYLPVKHLCLPDDLRVGRPMPPDWRKP